MWLLPSRRRPHLLKNVVLGAKKTEVTTPCRILIGMKDYFDNQKEYKEIESILPPHWQIIQTEEVEFGMKVREVWPLVENEKWVGLLNDDFHFVTPKWDQILVSKLDGKNFASSNDRWLAPQKAATATAFSMDLIKAAGFLFPPGNRHLFVDDFWEAIGKATGCWRICMNVVVEHHHQMRGFGPQGGDGTHQRIYNDFNFAAEKTAYDMFMNAVVDPKTGRTQLQAIIDRVKALQESVVSLTHEQVSRAPTPTPATVTP